MPAINLFGSHSKSSPNRSPNSKIPIENGWLLDVAHYMQNLFRVAQPPSTGRNRKTNINVPPYELLEDHPTDRNCWISSYPVPGTLPPKVVFAKNALFQDKPWRKKPYSCWWISHVFWRKITILSNSLAKKMHPSASVQPGYSRHQYQTSARLQCWEIHSVGKSSLVSGHG